MAFEKQDSFSPKRSTNVDGFFTQSAEEAPHQPKGRHSRTKPQLSSASLRDMPKRSEAQPILMSAGTAGAPTTTPEEREKHKRHPYRSWKRTVKRVRLILGIAVLLGCCLLGFEIYKAVTKFATDHSSTTQQVKTW